MNTNKNRLGVHLLDEAELDQVGGGVVGGVDFADGVEITLNLLSIAAIVTAAFCACMTPEQRTSWWNTFISNFSRASVSNTADDAGDIEAADGNSNAATNLGNIEITLDNSQHSDAVAVANVQSIAGGTWTCR